MFIRNHLYFLFSDILTVKLIQRPEFCKGVFKATYLTKESHLNSAGIPKLENNSGYVIKYLLFAGGRLSQQQ